MTHLTYGSSPVILQALNYSSIVPNDIIQRIFVIRANLLNIVFAKLSEFGVQSEVSGSFWHHFLNLSLALWGEILLLTMLFQTFLSSCITRLNIWTELQTKHKISMNINEYVWQKKGLGFIINQSHENRYDCPWISCKHFAIYLNCIQSHDEQTNLSSTSQTQNLQDKHWRVPIGHLKLKRKFCSSWYQGLVILEQDCHVQHSLFCKVLSLASLP